MPIPKTTTSYSHSPSKQVAGNKSDGISIEQLLNRVTLETAARQTHDFSQYFDHTYALKNNSGKEFFLEIYEPAISAVANVKAADGDVLGTDRYGYTIKANQVRMKDGAVIYDSNISKDVKDGVVQGTTNNSASGVLIDTDFSFYGDGTNAGLLQARLPLVGEIAGKNANIVKITKRTEKLECKRILVQLPWTGESRDFSTSQTHAIHGKQCGEIIADSLNNLDQLALLETTNTYVCDDTNDAVVTGGSAKGLTGHSLYKKANGSGDYDDLVAPTSTSYIGNQCVVNATDFRNVRNILLDNGAKKTNRIITASSKYGTQSVEEAFTAIINTDVRNVLEGLKNIHGKPALTLKKDYANQSGIRPQEVGALDEFRFTSNSKVVHFAGAGALLPAEDSANEGTDQAVTDYTNAGGDLAFSQGDDGKYRFDVHIVLIPTDGAAAKLGIQGKDKLRTHTVSPETKSLDNPGLDQGKFVAQAYHGAKVIRPEYCLVMYTCVKSH